MHRHRILIVEDDADTRSALGFIFSRMGWRVRLAATAAEGIDWINSGQEPCCQIIDLNLPDGRGEEIVRLTREKSLRSYVAVCTGITDDARLAAIEPLQPDAIIIKPMTPVDLRNIRCPISDQERATDDWPVIP
jgi:DNA-binding response OmpR family regulator